MNILYLHGLESKLSNPKRKILQEYGSVFAPDIDYEKRHLQPKVILSKYPEVEFNVIIGSSMGALNGYIISENIGRLALLFNPPLIKYRKINFSARFTKGLAYKQLLLGGSDEVVNPSETMEFLGRHLKKSELEIITDPQLGHRIPQELFWEQVRTFFSKLCY
ncbi:hypothetical protein RM549_02985 [Salegentibacter sp. F188]|uniref:Alpha/beta hydrolase n=1 Tax=Autumnicola patrickiae TaxID=3075591 RepID=A0ABU3DYC5_9FLAO|nr:hypothetical protein [Salegentibacter sp. F188]MDT0688730.1 hypothetical protein [Salegentibacter sp. F188]